MRRPSGGAAVTALAIGTSAGGVEALTVLLPALPAASLVPVFIVLHQPRHRPSLTVEIFGPRCQVPVKEAEDKDPVVPGTVYFAPPDYHLLVDRGERGLQLALSTDAPVHFSRPSADVLFESAADVYGPGLLGIVLTGASRDGAAGLAAVARAGGRTLVQDPAGAYMPVMPEAAIAASPASQVRSLAEIAVVMETVALGVWR